MDLQRLSVNIARNLWKRHPGVRHDSDLTPGERAADRLRNGMGSWAFVLLALLFLMVWMLWNRNTGFDPYPFILLNLVLSCVAALQGAILLIAARRQDQIAAELAMHDYTTNQEAAAGIRELQRMLTDMEHRLAQISGPDEQV